MDCFAVFFGREWYQWLLPSNRGPLTFCIWKLWGGDASQSRSINEKMHVSLVAAFFKEKKVPSVLLSNIRHNATTSCIQVNQLKRSWILSRPCSQNYHHQAATMTTWSTWTKLQSYFLCMWRRHWIIGNKGNKKYGHQHIYKQHKASNSCGDSDNIR